MGQPKPTKALQLGGIFSGGDGVRLAAGHEKIMSIAKRIGEFILRSIDLPPIAVPVRVSPSAQNMWDEKLVPARRAKDGKVPGAHLTDEAAISEQLTPPDFAGRTAVTPPRPTGLR